MDRQYIERNQIVDRYVMGRLSDEEADRFQRYYFEHPEILEEIALARAMIDGLEANTDLLAAKPAPKLLDQILGWLTTPAWALAAPVAALAIGAIFVAPLIGTPGPAGLRDYSISSELYLVRSRGAPEPSPIATRARTGLLLIVVDVAGLEASGLLGELRRGNEKEPLIAIALFPDEDDLAQTVVPMHRLAPGDYAFRVIDHTGASLSYEFTISDGETRSR